MTKCSSCGWTKKGRKNERKKRRREVKRVGEIEPLETWDVWKSSQLWCSTYIFKEKPKQMHASWFRKKIEWEMLGVKIKYTEQKESGKGLGLWPPETSLSLSQPFFFLFSVSLLYLPKPSNYSNEWLRAWQREAVRDWEDKWGRRRDGRKKEIHHCFLSAMSVTHALTLHWLVSED